MMTVSSYSSYESAGLQNVEFTSGNPATSGGTPLYAWCESGCTNSVSSVLWVNLGSSTIGASGGTLTVYMNFMPSSVMTSSTAYIGEAPQLYGGSYAQASYAQYDNGALTFPSFYDNFAGTTRSAKWTQVSNAATTISKTVNNGITLIITDSGASSPYYAYYSSSSFLPPNAIRTSAQIYGVSGIYPGDFGFGDYYNTYIGVYEQACTSAQYCFGSGIGVSHQTNGPGHSADSNYHIWDGYWSASSANFLVDGSSQYVSSTDIPSTANPVTIGNLGAGGNQGSVTGMSVHWILVHAYPPGGVMPTAGFGSVV